MQSDGYRIRLLQPNIPPLSRFTELVTPAWEEGIFTHFGPLVQQFEVMLTDIARTPAATVANATLGLELALAGLPRGSEVLTTAFSFVATLTAIGRAGLRARFADIDPSTLCLDPLAVEAALSSETSAILPVHVYGTSADVVAFEQMREQTGVRVVYDAAHAFGTTVGARSILSFGDTSVVSFHATKAVNCGEGGACFSADRERLDEIRSLAFYGRGHAQGTSLGTNAKMSELNAALGIASLERIDVAFERRCALMERYYENLRDLSSVEFQAGHRQSNGSYMPVLLETEELVLRVKESLAERGIESRRYFHPSLTTLAESDAGECPVAASAAERVLCLPLYESLGSSIVDEICDILINSC